MKMVKTDSQGRVQVFPIKAVTLTRGGTGNLTATFTATRNHRLATGQRVKVVGSNLIPFNGEFTITVSSATVFTYAMLVDPGGSATVTNVLAQGLLGAKEYAPFIGVTRNSGAMRVHGGPDAYYGSPDFQDDALVSEVPVMLYTALVRNKTAGDLYLYVYDSAALLGDGTRPTLPPFTVPAGGVWGYDFPGVPFVNGLYVAMSTSATAKVMTATAAGFFFVAYRDVL